jgi:Asp-tRNA(Asn)/Glu-tRNA(Gln) amidotransferase A subunit family amidase
MELKPCDEDTIVGLSRLISSRKMSCVELLRQCLNRIDEREAELRAWVHVDRQGAEIVARERDSELAAGQSRGPLHGIPVGIKDIIDVAGFPTAAGSILRAEVQAREDAEVVRRLRAAGAIILGKTVTTQFACYDPPVTRNPWNVERTPGGSSSGSAVAVASEMCPAALGSQTGGSITRPASFCGIAGCKPTFGRVSRRGVVPVSEHLDHVGPMARTVTDLAILMDAISGYDPRDPFCVSTSPINLQRALNEPYSTPPRLGRLRNFFDDHADACAITAVDVAEECWKTAGSRMSEPVFPSSFADLPNCHRAIMAVEAAGYHEKRISDYPDDYLPGIRSLIEEGLSLPVTQYSRSLSHQRQCSRDVLEMFADVNVLICPATVGGAPEKLTTGNPVLNSPWSYTGLPTVSIPVGLTNGGLPLSVQIVGKPFAEDELFRAAYWCETHLTNC